MLTLNDWQIRLADHFQVLRRERSAADGHRLYVLEHDLDAQERDALCEAVQSAIRYEAPSDAVYLPWIVYAAELGYLYAGEEYWQTFREETPGWSDNGTDQWLRRAFQRFARTYNGAQPRGDWARHFSIICWPITHAILPRDLQRQLANILFDLRFRLRIEHFNQPETLGNLIRSRAAVRSSRFATFAQDTALVGQIAAALLLRQTSETHHLLYPVTLDRIAEELDRERIARSWLADARERATQIQLRGVVRPVIRAAGQPVGNSSGGLSQAAPDTGGTVSYQRSTLGIDPRLVLRPEGGGQWQLQLEIPELQHLTESDEWRQILTTARCRVAGGGRRPLAPGLLLYGAQRVTLERWPRADEVLLQFEGASAAVTAALKTTCLLPPGPNWLFKVAADGRAYHVRSNVVRPGADYVLVRTAPLEYDHALTAAEVRCSGAHAGRISVPEHVTPSVDGILRVLGLTRASSIRLTPAGLPPLFWDGEGHVEWLSTDTPVIAVERQASGEDVELVLLGSDEPPLRITGEAPSPAYVQLPELPAGTHTVGVRAVGTELSPEREGRLEITVRAPRPWTGTLGEQHAVQVEISPVEPTLEDLLAGRVRIDVRGRAGLPVRSSATLWSYRREKVIYQKSLPDFVLPFDSGAWHRSFVRDFLNDKPVEKELPWGWAVEVEFVFGSVASQRLLCVRHLSPLRWSVRVDRDAIHARLSDDTGLDAEPEVRFHSFSEPDNAVPVTWDSDSGSLHIPDAGGLVRVRQGEHTSAIVVAPTGIRDLAALQLTPHLGHYRRAPDGIAGLLRLASLWAGATAQGQMARMRQCQVLRAIHCSLVQIFCSPAWANAERRFLVTQNPDARLLTREITRNPAETKVIVNPLQRIAETITAEPWEDRADRLCGIITRVGKYKGLDPAHAALALEVMSVPERLGDRTVMDWPALLDHPVLMRAARFLVVATQRASAGEDITAIPLYAGWN